MDVTEKRALKKYLIFLLPFLIAPIVGYFIPWYQSYKLKAQESYLKFVGQAIHTAEQSYHQEWKKYSSSLKDVGFNPDMKDIIIYTKKEEIPESDLSKIEPENYPYSKVDVYQIILKWTNKDNGLQSLWILDESGIVRKIEP